MSAVVDVLFSAGLLVVSTVLLLAGAAKLADRAGFTNTLKGFGIARRLQAPLSGLIPALEIGLAVCLLAPGLSHEAAIGASGLLFSFAVVLAVVGRRAEPPECGCFGALGRHEPVDSRALVRASTLAGVAGLAAGYGSDHGVLPLVSSVGGWRNTMLVVSLVVIVLAGAVVGVLLHRYGTALHRIQHLETMISDAAPLPKSGASTRTEGTGRALAVASGAASVRVLSDLGYSWDGSRQTHLVVFVNPSCPGCASVMRELVALQPQVTRAGFGTVVVAGGDRGSVEGWRRQLGFATPFVHDTGEAARAFGIPGTPAALLVDSAGSPRTAPVVGYEAVIGLTRSAAGGDEGADRALHGSVPLELAQLEAEANSAAEGVAHGRLG